MVRQGCSNSWPDKLSRTRSSPPQCEETLPGSIRMAERLHLAIQSYQGGMSVLSIGKELSVSGETVRKALTKAGVKLRPRRGWE